MPHSPRLSVFLLVSTLSPFLVSTAVGQVATGEKPLHAPPSSKPAECSAPAGLSAQDWTSIRMAYEESRHAVNTSAGGHEARNPGQRWTAHFDGRGFLLEPDSARWSWGLECVSFGRRGAEQGLSGPALVTTAGTRVSYRWSANLEEWYVNDGRGLEHGYTIEREPARNAESGRDLLVFTLSVRGPLDPEVSVDGRSVRFLGDEGVTALDYSGLRVFDADGRGLGAWFESGAEGLRLFVDDAGARYPVTVDPLVQQAYLKASKSNGGDWFGCSVAASGNTVAIGARGEAGGATGVNGNPADNSKKDSGAAYVFVKSGATWSQEAYVKASNTDAWDLFGMSVALDGDTLVVGAIDEDSSATGVNGDQADNSTHGSGAAYVFVRQGHTWSQEAYLKASNTGWYDNFGWAVSISGDTIVISALGESSAATGVDGDQGDDTAYVAGAAYVFVRNGTTWSQQAYLKASNTDGGDQFGRSVSVSGDTIVVGADQEDSTATGIDGNQGSNGASHAGAAYVFVRNGTTWSQQAYVKASNTDLGDYFGIFVSLSGDSVVVGASGEDSFAHGVNGDQQNNASSRAGAAYVFVRNGTTWSQEAYLKAHNTQSSASFGNSVSISGDMLAVGSDGEKSVVYASGAVYLFERSGTTWSQQAFLKASNPDTDDKFGKVALSGSTLVVGAPYEESAADGVNGDQSDNSIIEAGAAYTFEIPATMLPGYPTCVGSAGSGTPCPCNNDNDGSLIDAGCANGVFASGAKLVGSGTASLVADTLRLTTRHLEPDNAGLYFQADNDLSPGVAWGDGLRCAGGNLKRLGVVFSNAFGYSDTAGLPTSISVKVGNIEAGDTKYYQCWYRTTVNPPCGLGVNDFNTSNGYAVAWHP